MLKLSCRPYDVDSLVLTTITVLGLVLAGLATSAGTHQRSLSREAYVNTPTGLKLVVVGYGTILSTGRSLLLKAV